MKEIMKKKLDEIYEQYLKEKYQNTIDFIDFISKFSKLSQDF